MNVKQKVVGVAALFFLGISVDAQRVKKDTTTKTREIDEVVLVGYGKVAKKDLTGSITTVDSKSLLEQPVTSVTQALQGKAPGVQIVSTSGRSGDNSQISIRGNGSLSASNSVLYIIDGVPQETMNNVSPEDVKSMQILKDAASTAIYGSRASNGVVIIETKSGRFNGRPSVSFSSSLGFQQIIKKQEMLNASQYREVFNAARQNYLNDIASGKLKAPANMSSLDALPNTPYDTDWLSLVLRTGQIRNNQISISSGGESTKVYFSASNINQEGIIKQDSYEISRFRLNAEQKIGNKFSFGVQSYFTMSNATPLVDDNNSYQPWSNAMNARPYISPYNPDGTINSNGGSNNPLFAFQRQVTDKWQNLGGTLFFNYEILKGLTWRSAYSGNIASRRYNRFDAPNTRRGLNGDGVPTGYGYYGTDNNRDYLMENTLTYDKSFVDSRLKMTLLSGHTFQKWQYEDSYLQGEKFPSDDLRWLVSAAEINKGRSYFMEMALESIFARAQFSWDRKYHLMASIRRDGSSKFLPENRWGSFPAASLGWTVSNEEFFNVKAINNLKLRASFGYTGNQSGISYASGQNLIGSGYNYNQNPGLATVELFNPNLKWEKGRAINIGMDLSMFKNRLNLTADLYEKRTEDLLDRIAVANETGFATQLRNVGSIKNSGFEIGLNAEIIKNQDFKWELGSNFSYNKNIIEKIGNKAGYYTTGFASIVKEGAALGSFYLLESLGVAKEEYQYKNAAGVVTKTVQAGDMIFRDVNGDGKIDTNDRVLFEGGIAPIYGGISTKFAYKNIDLSANAQYSIGKKVYAMYEESALSGASGAAPSYSNNMIASQLDYWSPNNPNAVNPRPHMASVIAGWNNQRSSRFLHDADYLRITGITLGYNFNKDAKPKFIRSMRIYAQVRNPFTFTKYPGVDPEVQYLDQTVSVNQSSADRRKIQAGVDYNGIPNVKIYTLGLNVNF